MMHTLFRSLVLLLMLIATLSMVSCSKTIKSEEMPANISVGGSYYTQVDIRYEKGRHLTTNYRRGKSIAVNTPVKLLKINQKVIEVEMINSGQKLQVKNVRKHTGDDIFRTFDKMFAKTEVNLARFTKLERKHIQSGSVAKGMSKKAVIIAIGYPPVTQTRSLDSNTWVYWSGRYNRFKVHFKNGKVSNIED